MRNSISIVFSDLDDTLTEQGSIAASAISALYALKSEGILAVIVTGRPEGWADCLVRILPVHAVIYENGAGILIHDGEKLEKMELVKASVQNQKRLMQIFKKMRKHHPELVLASDQPQRRFDVAINIAEDIKPLSKSTVDSVLKILQKEKGVTAKLSSIHINYWVGKYSKVDACKEYLRIHRKTKDEAAFVGDSANDEPLFRYFDNSYGVANVANFLSGMKFHPRYITEASFGEGFAEAVRAILRTR